VRGLRDVNVNGLKSANRAVTYYCQDFLVKKIRLTKEYLCIFNRNRFQQQGANTGVTPALLRDLSKILQINPGIDPEPAKSKVHLLGWNGVALDYQSLELALARSLEWVEMGG
jgi:hypothetical protein